MQDLERVRQERLRLTKAQIDFVCRRQFEKAAEAAGLDAVTSKTKLLRRNHRI